MPSKAFALDEGLIIKIYKRRSNRNLRLSVASSGEVRVSIPTWIPYRVGLEFARSRQAWIKTQTPTSNQLKDGQPVGKAHHLSFVAADTVVKASSRIDGTTIAIRYPIATSPASPAIQRVAALACVRALRSQAEALLPKRLQALADKHNFSYGRVSVKRLKGRWGSCDHQGNITLNLFLMQLPWELIDYVLLHELTHTVVPRHGPDFWNAMEQILPDVKSLRKHLRSHQPVL